MTSFFVFYAVTMMWAITIGVAGERAKDDTWHALWRELARPLFSPRLPSARISRRKL